MSCLTKISLFFMILSIVCNPSFADRAAECEKNVRLVYYEDLDVREGFFLSMYFLNLNSIKTMTDTVELANSLLQQVERFKSYLLEMFELWVFSHICHDIKTQYVEFTKREKKDIAGYFEQLIVNFETIYGDFRNAVLPPAHYCEDKYSHALWVCRRALSTLLKTSDQGLNDIDAVEAYKHCYLNYRLIDFYNNSIFSESGSSSSSSSTTIPDDPDLFHILRVGYIEKHPGSSPANTPSDQQLLHDLEIFIAKNYFITMADNIGQLAVKKYEEQPMILMTVEKYCSKAK